MALFTYQCSNEECEMEEFDKIVPISARDEEQTCPVCQIAGCQRKKVVLTNFRLTGTGFYATDYKNNSNHQG